MAFRTNKSKSPGPDVWKSLMFLFKTFPSTVSNNYSTFLILYGIITYSQNTGDMGLLSRFSSRRKINISLKAIVPSVYSVS